MKNTDSPDNPYRVSRAAVKDGDSPPRRPIGTLIVAIVEVFVGLAAASRAPVVIGNFEELFKGFGADLPGLTRFILATRYGWWIFAVAAISILVWILRRPATTRIEQRRQTLSVVAYAITFGVAWGVTAVSLYLPIFKLGAAV